MASFRSWLFRTLGYLSSAEEHANALKWLTGELTGQAAAKELREFGSFNTSKASGLLGAQGLFLVAGTFALDHGWSRGPVLASLLILLAGAMLIMSTLRSTVTMYGRPIDTPLPIEAVYRLIVGRIVRFNIALFLTFVSVLLLAVAALGFF
jgi:hypothetical protein